MSVLLDNQQYDSPLIDSVIMQDAIPRLIARENGDIVFSNSAFCDVCDYQGSLEGHNIHSLMAFSIPAEQLNNGRHKVMLIDLQKELDLRFDWVSTEGQRFIVASAEEITPDNTVSESTTEREKLLQYVADKVSAKIAVNEDHTPFFSLSFDACCIMDSAGEFLNINENFTQMMGYEINDLKDMNLLDLVHPDHKGDFRSVLQSVRQHPEMRNAITHEACCINKSGAILWVEWNHKNIKGKIYSVARDVTPLKSYRESLKRQEKKLAEAEAIGHIGQWEWLIGSDHIQFSDQLYRIFGLEKGEVQPTLDNINRMIHRSDAGRMMQVFQRAIIEQNDYDMDFRITRPDGEIRFIRCEGRCEIDAEDDVVALYGIMQDVSETTNRELDLMKAKDSVERAYAAKTQFLANMSHELRTPLNAIIGFSEMIERQLLGPIGTEKYLEYIGGIRESGEHLLDLISDILDMSKIEAGKYELHLEKFNIAKVLRMAAHMMEGRALDADIKIKIDIANDDLVIVADRRAVMQMVLNLLSNAVKFSKDGKVINMQLAEKSDFLCVVVADEGIGIPANKLANITMPFEQAETDYTREYEGSGLGLSITKELTEIHGGQLQIESTIDVGTTVTIRLPYEATRG